MPRWRPPAEKSTAIITPEGHQRLKDELDHLWRVRRPEVVSALAAAAAEGDRSENAEYTYRKKQLGEIDRRVRYLSHRVPALRIVSETPRDQEVIYFGAWFEIEHGATGESQRHRIVGPDETDATLAHISIDSPMARSVLGRRIDDEVEVVLPSGTKRFVVTAVAYPPDTLPPP